MHDTGQEEEGASECRREPRARSPAQSRFPDPRKRPRAALGPGPSEKENKKEEGLLRILRENTRAFGTDSDSERRRMLSSQLSRARPRALPRLADAPARSLQSRSLKANGAAAMQLAVQPAVQPTEKK